MRAAPPLILALSISMLVVGALLATATSAREAVGAETGPRP